MHGYIRQRLRPRYPASVWLAVGIIVAGAMQTQFSGYTKWFDLLCLLILVVLMRRQCHREGEEMQQERIASLERKEAREQARYHH